MNPARFRASEAKSGAANSPTTAFCGSASLLTLVNTEVYYWVVTARELRKLLKASGCTFRTGKGHDKVYLGSRQTALPRHGTDIGLKDLGIEKEKK